MWGRRRGECPFHFHLHPCTASGTSCIHGDRWRMEQSIERHCSSWPSLTFPSLHLRDLPDKCSTARDCLQISPKPWSCWIVVYAPVIGASKWEVGLNSKWVKEDRILSVCLSVEHQTLLRQLEEGKGVCFITYHKASSRKLCVQVFYLRWSVEQCPGVKNDNSVFDKVAHVAVIHTVKVADEHIVLTRA